MLRNLSSLSLALILLLALAGVSGAAENAELAPPEEVVDFTDAPSGVSGVGDAFDVYCVYNIGATSGDCGRFASGDTLCVDCPDSGTCPLAANTIGHFRYLAADGTVICTGDWARRFNLRDPDACIECTDGQTGYRFVN